MDYYSKKNKAVIELDEMLKNKIPMPIIIYKISTKYSFSERFVKNRIKEIEDMQDACIPKIIKSNISGMENNMSSSLTNEESETILESKPIFSEKREKKRR